MSRQGKLVIFSAPSGSGKTTLVRHLLAHEPRLAFSISATSRAPRGAEVHGKDYYFLSPSEFDARVAAGDFLEWEEVYPGTCYGTLKSEVTRLWNAGKDVIFDIDVVGGLNLKRQFGPQALAVFVALPSEAELERRLRLRGTESEEKLAMRLGKAREEMTYQPQFDVVLMNDHAPTAQAEALALVSGFLNR
jgi:guanylate kinase